MDVGWGDASVPRSRLPPSIYTIISNIFVTFRSYFGPGVGACALVGMVICRNLVLGPLYSSIPLISFVFPF